MKHLFLLLCLLGAALSIRQDKKINLDDIERDNIKSERKVKAEKQPPKTQPAPPATTYIEQPQLEAAPQVSYVQQAPPPAAYIAQAPPQYAYAPQAPPQVEYAQQAPPQYAYAQQATPQVAYTQQATPQYSFSPVKTLQNYAQQQQHVSAAPSPQYYRSYSQYDLPVVADNSISQPTYYHPQQQQQQQQYVYLQPAAASQVEPRATIQYVMYIPAPAAAATQPAAAYVASPKTESLLQSAQEYLNALPSPQAYATAQEYGYDVAGAPAQRYLQQQQPQQQQQQQPQIQYAYIQEPPKVNEPSPESSPAHHNNHQQEFVEQYVAMAPAQPQSLLDSYVPSYLQVQYFKQQKQQSQKNSIQETGKDGSAKITGKTDIVKSQHGSESSYKYKYDVPEY